MIWGLEGRHTWIPPALAALTPLGALPDPPATYKDIVLGLEPSLYWTLDATSGATDLSGNGHNGTGFSGILIGASTSLTRDPSDDGSTQFDGVNDKITSTYGPFTAGAAVTVVGIAQKSALVAAAQPLFGASGNGPNLYVGAVVDDQEVGWDQNTGTAGSFPTWLNIWPDPATSDFVAWALTADDSANTAELFINGVSQGVKTDTEAFAGGNFLLGMSHGATEFWDGSLSHVAIFQHVLTDAEIALLAAARVYEFTDPPVTFKRKSDTAVKLWPRYDLTDIGGLFASGESGDRRDNRVGVQGEIPRKSKRRGKSIPYTGMIKAQNRTDLEQSAQALIDAFDDQDKEGLMVVTPNPLYDASGDYRYFYAKTLTVDITDQLASPFQPSFGHEWGFVASVRNARANGISYYDQDGKAYK